MNIGLAFSYVFKDKDWFKKLGIAGLIGLIPIVGQFVVIGWAMKIAKNVMDGFVETALPNVNFGEDLKHGFMVSIINLLYALPAGILLGIAAVLFGVGSGTEENARTVMMIFGGCLGLIGLIVAFVIAFMGMVGVTNYLAKGQFGAAFNFKEVFGLLKGSFVSWLLVILVGGLAASIIAPLGTIACGLGVILTATYVSAVNGHLLGQAYNKAAGPSIIEVEDLSFMD